MWSCTNCRPSWPPGPAPAPSADNPSTPTPEPQPNEALLAGRGRSWRRRWPGPHLLVDPLHCAPLAVVVTQRLVDQVQVDVVQPEPLQRGVEGAPGVLARCLDPQLGGDKELFARDAAGGDGAADGVLVGVGGGGVDVPVAGGQGVADGLLGLLGGDLVDAEAEDRHLHTVVESDGRRRRGAHGELRAVEGTKGAGAKV